MNGCHQCLADTEADDESTVLCGQCSAALFEEIEDATRRQVEAEIIAWLRRPLGIGGAARSREWIHQAKQRLAEIIEKGDYRPPKKK